VVKHPEDLELPLNQVRAPDARRHLELLVGQVVVLINVDKGMLLIVLGCKSETCAKQSDER